MENQNKFINRIYFSRFISIAFIAISINAISKGVEYHQTWRVVLAGLGLICFLFLFIATYIKKWQMKRKV